MVCSPTSVYFFLPSSLLPSSSFHPFSSLIFFLLPFPFLLLALFSSSSWLISRIRRKRMLVTRHHKKEDIVLYFIFLDLQGNSHHNSIDLPPISMVLREARKTASEGLHEVVRIKPCGSKICLILYLCYFR